MKKSVGLLLVLSGIALFFVLTSGYSAITGLQALDLPAPPSPPGMEEQVQPAVVPPVPVCGNGILEGREQCERDSHCSRSEYCRRCACVKKSTNDSGAYVNVQLSGDVADLSARVTAIEKKLGALDLLFDWEARLNEVELKVAEAQRSDASISSLESAVRQLEVDVQNLKSAPAMKATFFEKLSFLEGMSSKNAMLSISLSIFVLLLVIGLVVATILGRNQDRIENKRLIRQYLENYMKQGYDLETLQMHLRACGWKEKIIQEASAEVTS